MLLITVLGILIFFLWTEMRTNKEDKKLGLGRRVRDSFFDFGDFFKGGIRRQKNTWQLFSFLTIYFNIFFNIFIILQVWSLFNFSILVVHNLNFRIIIIKWLISIYEMNYLFFFYLARGLYWSLGCKFIVNTLLQKNYSYQ